MAKVESLNLIVERDDVVTNLVDIVIDFTMRVSKENEDIYIPGLPFTDEIDKLINYILDLCYLSSLEEDVETQGARTTVYWFLWFFYRTVEFLKDKEPFSRVEAALYILNWNNSAIQKEIKQRHPIFFRHHREMFLEQEKEKELRHEYNSIW